MNKELMVFKLATLSIAAIKVSSKLYLVCIVKMNVEIMFLFNV